MFNVCPECGANRPDKLIDPTGPYAVCPECSHRHRFGMKPLLVVGGPSGAGKSCVLALLLERGMPAVLLEADLFWTDSLDDPEHGFSGFVEHCLRVAKNVNQSDRTCVLFGAGLVVPANVEPCVERRYFSAVHYLALNATDEALRARLLARPGWRRSGSERFITAQLEFSHWLREQGGAPTCSFEHLETAMETPPATATKVERWIRARIG